MPALVASETLQISDDKATVVPEALGFEMLTVRLSRFGDTRFSEIGFRHRAGIAASRRFWARGPTCPTLCSSAVGYRLRACRANSLQNSDPRIRPKNLVPAMKRLEKR